jgi:hypothetical protein
MEMVPDPVVEDHETGCDPGCVAVCFELGETREITLTLSFFGGEREV